MGATGVVMGDHLEPMRFKEQTFQPRLTPAVTTDFNLLATQDDREGELSLAGADDFEDQPGIHDDAMRGVNALKQAGIKRLAQDWHYCCIGCGIGFTFFEAAAPA